MNLSPRHRFSARGAWAVLLLAHLLAVVVLAASPRLHHWLHPDADDDGHECAVVWFVHGSTDAGPTPVALPVFARAEAAAFMVAVRPAAFVPSVLRVIVCSSTRRRDGLRASFLVVAIRKPPWAKPRAR